MKAIPECLQDIARATRMQKNDDWLQIKCKTMHNLGVDRKLDTAMGAEWEPVAILMPDKPELAWAKGITRYRDLPVLFAPVIIEPEIAYRYVEMCKEGKDDED